MQLVVRVGWQRLPLLLLLLLQVLALVAYVAGLTKEECQEDRTGVVRYATWLATDTQLVRLERDTWSKVEERALPSSQTTAVAAAWDRQSVWLADSDGVSRASIGAGDGMVVDTTLSLPEDTGVPETFVGMVDTPRGLIAFGSAGPFAPMWFLPTGAAEWVRCEQFGIPSSTPTVIVDADGDISILAIGSPGVSASYIHVNVWSAAAAADACPEPTDPVLLAHATAIVSGCPCCQKEGPDRYWEVLIQLHLPDERVHRTLAAVYDTKQNALVTPLAGSAEIAFQLDDFGREEPFTELHVYPPENMVVAASTDGIFLVDSARYPREDGPRRWDVDHAPVQDVLLLRSAGYLWAWIAGGAAVLVFGAVGAAGFCLVRKHGGVTNIRRHVSSKRLLRSSSSSASASARGAPAAAAALPADGAEAQYPPDYATATAAETEPASIPEPASGNAAAEAPIAAASEPPAVLAAAASMSPPAADVSEPATGAPAVQPQPVASAADDDGDDITAPTVPPSAAETDETKEEVVEVTVPDGAVDKVGSNDADVQGS